MQYQGQYPSRDNVMINGHGLCRCYCHANSQRDFDLVMSPLPRESQERRRIDLFRQHALTYVVGLIYISDSIHNEWAISIEHVTQSDPIRVVYCDVQRIAISCVQSYVKLVSQRAMH